MISQPSEIGPRRCGPIVFVGDADTIWRQCLDEWDRGQHATRCKQSEPTDARIGNSG